MSFLNIKISSKLLFLALAVLVVFCILSTTVKKQVLYKDNPYWAKIVAKIHKSQTCLSIRFSKATLRNITKVWKYLEKDVRNCTKDFDGNYLNLQKVGKGKTQKFWISSKFQFDSCIFVCWGCENDIKKEFQRKLPHCKFHGFPQGKTLVGTEPSKKPEETISEYLHSFGTANAIDYLFVGGKTNEFALMKELIKNPIAFPAICQLNIILRNPYSKDRNDVMTTLTENAIYEYYLPLKVKFVYNSNEIFFVNTKSQECIMKYLINK